jgi:hypothetical protein
LHFIVSDPRSCKKNNCRKKIFFLRNLQIRRINIGGNNRAERAKGVERFAQEPLATVALLLPVPTRHVVGDCVAKNVVEGGLLRDVAAFFADDYC